MSDRLLPLNMHQDDLIKIREVFRARMKERDFCRGEEEVEKLFRELLGEPEPVIEPLQMDEDGRKRIKEILELELKRFTEKLPGLFERDDAFYKGM